MSHSWELTPPLCSPQIRHALYTCERFQRVPGSADLWQLTPAQAASAAQIQRVLVRAEEVAASVTVSAAPSTAAAAGWPTGGAPVAAAAVPSTRVSPPAGARGGAKRGRMGRWLSPGAEEEGSAVSAASPRQPAAARSPCLATPPPMAQACSAGAERASPALTSLVADDDSVLQDCQHHDSQCHDSPLAAAATNGQRRRRQQQKVGSLQRTASAAAQSPAADVVSVRSLHCEFATAAAASPAQHSTRQRRRQQRQQQGADSATAAGQPAPSSSASDLSTLRWGRKALRSTFTITIAPSPSHLSAVGLSGGSHASLVAAALRGLQQAQAASSEAEPQAHAHLLYRRSASNATDGEASHAAKRRALQPAETRPSPEEDAAAAATAAATASLPLLLSLLQPAAAATAAAAATGASGALPAGLHCLLPGMGPYPPLAGVPALVPISAALLPSEVQGQLAAALLAAAASGAATPGHTATPAQ